MFFIRATNKIISSIKAAVRSVHLEHEHRRHSFSPLVNCLINCALLKATPGVHQASSKLRQISYWCPINSFLYPTPDAVVDRIKIWTVRWPHVRSNEVWSSSTVRPARCAGGVVLLEHIKIASDAADGRQQLLRQQFFSIIGTIDFCTGFNKHQLAAAELRDGQWYHDWLAECGPPKACVLRKMREWVLQFSQGSAATVFR